MQTFTVAKDEQNRLILKRPGQADVVDVQVRRAFPWSNPQAHISICAADGKEVLMVDNLNEIAQPTRELIAQSLENGSFIPRILQVREVVVRFGFQRWRVRTNRGDTEFRVQEREDIRFLPDGRFSIRDADGNVYELPRIDELDESTRRAIERVV